MPGISTTFNSDELSFISSTDWFLQKNSVSVKTSELLHHTALKLKHHLGPTLNPHSFKVSKGENYKGFPYFVLDIPKITSVEEMATLRIILDR